MSESPPTPASSRSVVWCRIGFVLLVFGLALAAYWPALRGGFIWNDADYVTAPGLRSWHGLKRIWFELGATQQYYPLLHSAFWVEYRLWGSSSFGYHLWNVALHATAACLFALVLTQLWRLAELDETRARRATWPAAFAGLIFALHPVCVESVAWISEQKNTLSLVFYLLSALAYLDFDRRRRPLAYGLALALYLMGLLSKSTTATLPAALLVAFWWRRGRLEFRRDLLPLLPWLALGAASGLFSGWVEKTYIGADGSAFDLSFVQRLLLAGRIAWFYVGKLLWPANLIFIYPRWRIDPHQLWQYLFVTSAAILVVLLALGRGRTRGALAAVLFFGGSLFPTLGFFNVYAFIFSFVADHWQYLPCLGIIALAAGAWGRWRQAGGPLPLIAAALLVAVLGTLSWRQSRMYFDIKTFYVTTLARNPQSWMAHNNLANVLRGEGRRQEAMVHFRQALRIKPDIFETHNNLGAALRESGQVAEAMAEFREAIREFPKYAEARANLALSLGETGHPDQAVAEFQRSLSLGPAIATTHNSFGVVLAQLGRNAEARAHIEEAIRLDPTLYEAYSNLGNVLCQEGRPADGIVWYRRALEHNPDNIGVRDDLGTTLAQMGKKEEALAELGEALRRAPNSADTHYDMYIILMDLARFDEAMKHQREARRLNPNIGN